MNKELNIFLDTQLSAAADLALGVDQISPMWALVDTKKQVTLIVSPWGNDDEKDAIVTAVKAKMKQDGTVMYAHIAEAWMAKVSLDDPDKLMKIRPSEREDKEEVIIVTVNDHLDTVMGMLSIERDDQGKIIGTKRLPTQEGRFEGRMVELLR
jgi:hypothetical protein